MDSAVQATRLSDELLKRLQETNNYDQFSNDFSNCISESDRFACVYKLSETEGLFNIQEKFKRKDKKSAEICRAEGNKYFNGKSYQRALEFYTLSILRAPDDSENLSLAYNNRSITNLKLKQYVLCLQDIELSFLHNYPKKSCYKLYQRRGRCMYHLRHKGEAIRAFHQTIVTLDCAELEPETRKEMVEDMRQAILQCDAVTGFPVSTSVKHVNNCHQGVPRLSSERSQEVPCLSDAVEIKLDSYGGRGLYAKRNINVGEVLIVETPFTSALLSEYNVSHCHYCCNRLFLAIPCHMCSGVAFCSLDCRKTAWQKFHWAECKILDNIQDSKGDLGLLATRMILTAGYDTLVNIQMSQEVERLKGFSADGQYRSDSYTACYSLVHHHENRTFKDLLTRTVSALFFLKHLELMGFFSAVKRKEALSSSPNSNSDEPMLPDSTSNMEDISDPEDNTALSEEILFRHKCTVGGHILRNIMMLPCNAHEVSELDLNMSNPAMSSTTELAGAIYPVLSLINHSCDPSVVRHSFGNLCIARAIRNMKAGDELKDNYGALYPTMDLQTRQSNMKSQYFFSCSCDACLNDWPLYFDIPCESPILRCSNSNCDGRVPIIPNSLSMERVVCERCGINQDISTELLKIGRLEASYKSTLMSVIDGDNSNENFQNLQTYLQLVESTIHRPWRDINDCQEALKQCLSMKANCYASSSSS